MRVRGPVILAIAALCLGQGCPAPTAAPPAIADPSTSVPAGVYSGTVDWVLSYGYADEVNQPRAKQTAEAVVFNDDGMPLTQGGEVIHVGYASQTEFGNGVLQETINGIVTSENGIVVNSEATMIYNNSAGTLRGPAQRSYRLLPDGRIKVDLTVSTSGEYSGYPYYENHVGTGVLTR